MILLSASDAVSMRKFSENIEKFLFTEDGVELRKMVKERLEFYKYANVIKAIFFCKPFLFITNLLHHYSFVPQNSTTWK